MIGGGDEAQDLITPLATPAIPIRFRLAESEANMNDDDDVEIQKLREMLPEGAQLEVTPPEGLDENGNRAGRFTAVISTKDGTGCVGVGAGDTALEAVREARANCPDE